MYNILTGMLFNAKCPEFGNYIGNILSTSSYTC